MCADVHLLFNCTDNTVLKNKIQANPPVIINNIINNNNNNHSFWKCQSSLLIVSSNNLVVNVFCDQHRSRLTNARVFLVDSYLM